MKRYKKLSHVIYYKEKTILGHHFWSRGYYSSTIGLDEEKIRKYIQYQEDKEQQEEAQQLDLGLF